MFDLHDASIWVGAVTFAAMIPRFLFSPFAGLIVDRFDRRGILGTVLALSSLHTIVLALLVIVEAIQVEYVIALAFLDGSARAVLMPATGALIPNLVPRTHLLNAVALNAATTHGSRFLGPLAVSPFMGGAGIAGAFILCGCLYALGIALTLVIKTSSSGVVRKDQTIVKNILEGVIYLYHHPLLRPLLLLTVMHCAFTMSFESLLPALSVEKLDAQESAFSYLMMSVGAGALIGVMFLAGIKNDAIRGKVLLFLGIFSGLTPIALAGAPTLPIALVAAASMGISQSTFMALFATIVQSTIPDSIRGRVTSVNNLHIGGSMALCNLMNGALADILGAPILLFIPGVAFAIIMVVSLRLPSLQMFYGANKLRQ